MVRRVFFSFHYQRDIFRVNQIRSIGNIIPAAAVGFHDASLWEEAKSVGTVQRKIDEALERTSVTVICIGYRTAGRRWINYEIQESIDRGNGIVAVRINHLPIGLARATDPDGDIPFKISSRLIPVRRYTNHRDLGFRIEQAAREAGR